MVSEQATSSSGDEHVKGGVQTEAIDAAEVAVVVSDDLVVLEVPACEVRRGAVRPDTHT